MFPIGQALVNGGVLAVVFCVVVVASLWWNARIWVDDLPPIMRATQSPLNDAEKRQRAIFVVLFLAAWFGTTIALNAMLRAQMGAAFTLGVAYLHTWVMLQVTNLADAVVLDWVYIVMIQPKHLILPGTEHLLYALEDKGWHLSNYIKGVVICTVLAVPFALVAMI